MAIIIIVLRRLFKTQSILLCLIFLNAISALCQEKFPPLTPLRTETPPLIDGILDDPVWQKAPHETGFKTYHPDYGIDMKEKTVVYYAYDRENLYFAFRCFDSQPDKIKASMTSRDTISPDDWICINLDSFNDHQSLYALYVNPMGIQGDSRFEAGTEDFTVDTVWYSHGRIDAEGYAVEIRIPFKSLRFSHKEPIEMGIIFERKISRRSESGTYPPLDPAQGMNFLTQTRTLIFHDIRHYTLLELLPGLTFSQRSSLEQGELVTPKGKGDPSLTAKYGITSQLILDGTANPDFSHVEADAGQIDFNLRYALFFPEKRPFFLEGKEKFNLAGSQEGDPIGAIVHTRTIVDPLLGIKLNGRVGDKDTVASIYALDELIEGGENFAHFSILRYKHALSNDGFLGGFYTGRHHRSEYNVVLGTDGQLRINPSSLFGYHLFLSQTRPESQTQKENGHALGLHYAYTTRELILMLGFQDIDQEFWTETGYITRTGISRLRTGILRMFYPRSKFIRRIDPMIHSTQIRDKSSGLYETDNSVDLRLILLKSSSLQFGYRYATEVYLDEKFNKSGLKAIASSQLSKRFSFNLTYQNRNKIRYISDPYQGRGNDASATISYLPSDKLHLDLSLVYSDFFRDDDSQKEYDYTIIRSRNTYQVNKYLFFRGIVEYNSFYKRLMTDFLASFTYIPGTVIHLGYGSLYEKIEWRDGEYFSSDRFLETNRGLFFKASFLWRL
jgi:hypothetical protein